MSLQQSRDVTWTIVVKGTPIQVAVIGDIPVSLQVGVPFSFQLAASGGTGIYSWSIDSPAGIGATIDQTGKVSGTPVQASAVDADGHYVPQAVVITVKDSEAA